MAAAVFLIENESQRGAIVGANVFPGFKHRPMRFADFGINAPGRFRFAIDGFGDLPVRLVKIGGGILQSDGPVRRRPGSRRRLQAKFGQVEVAIVLPARAFVRQAVIGQDFQPHGADIFQIGSRHDGVGVNLRFRAARQQRKVRLSGQRRAAGGSLRDGIQHRPDGRLRVQGSLPRRDFGLGRR